MSYPFQCDFCYNSTKNHRCMNREIEDVLEDIQAVDSKHIMLLMIISKEIQYGQGRFLRGLRHLGGNGM